MARDNTGDKASNGVEAVRLRLGYYLVLFAFVVIVVLFALLTFVKDTENLTTAFTGVTGVIGTLVAAFFGYQQGSAGKEKAEDKASKAQDQVSALKEVASTDVVDLARQRYPDLFR
jgi:hypothetical protein